VPIMVAGFVDDRPDLRGTEILGRPVLGVIRELHSWPHDGVVVGIGDNAGRRDVFDRLQATPENFVTVIHPRAVVAADVTIGPGTVIFAGAVVNTGSHIGANAILNTACTVDHHNAIADHVHVAPGVHLGGAVRLAEGALVGIGSTVMPGKHVGAWAVVGAGSLVKDDVPARFTVAGVPAKPLTMKTTARS